MRILKLILLVLFLYTPQLIASNCYLVIEQSGDSNDQTVTSLAVPLISKYIEIVAYIPVEGVSSNSCQYKLSVIENSENM